MKNIGAIFLLIRNYRKQAVFNVVLNIISVVFSLFSVLSMIPFLEILFGHTAPVHTVDAWTLSKDSITQHFYFYITRIIETEGESAAMVIVGAFIVTMTLLKSGFRFLSLYNLAPIQDGVVRDIRNRIFAKALSLPLSYYSDERKGDLMSRMTNDLNEIRGSVVSSLEVLFSAPITMLFYLGALLVMSPQLTLFVLVMLPISGYLIGSIGKSLKRQSYSAQAKMGELLSTIEETIGGLRIIKAFNAHDMVYRNFEYKSNEYFDQSKAIQRRQYLASPVSETMGTIVMVAIMWFGSSLVLSGKSTLSAEDFLAYLGIFYLIIPPSKSFSTASYNIRKGVASLQRINFILNAEEKISEKTDAEAIEKFADKIEFHNVSFSYAADAVLKNINMTVEKGKTVALVGQSGSGKSTLVDLIPRFYEVSEGAVTIDSHNVKDLKIMDLRNLLGIVNQTPILFNDTIANNIAFGMENAGIEAIQEAAKVANAHEFIVNTPEGYNTNIGDGGTKLSGGQRQRLSIARAVLKNPPILILDEATSALDTESERLVQDALTSLMKNRTTIVIAHRLSTIHQADEICVLHEGQIVERGKHDELIELNGVYRKLVDLQKFS